MDRSLSSHEITELFSLVLERYSVTVTTNAFHFIFTTLIRFCLKIEPHTPHAVLELTMYQRLISSFCLHLQSTESTVSCHVWLYLNICFPFSLSFPFLPTHSETFHN